jgi:hypothetical protein
MTLRETPFVVAQTAKEQLQRGAHPVTGGTVG